MEPADYNMAQVIKLYLLSQKCFAPETDTFLAAFDSMFDSDKSGCGTLATIDCIDRAIEHLMETTGELILVRCPAGPGNSAIRAFVLLFGSDRRYEVPASNRRPRHNNASRDRQRRRIFEAVEKRRLPEP